MPASRVESESKPEPKRWESDDYKADLTAHPEEIKDLCPIVITTIAAAPTQNKDADGNVIYEFDRTKAESDPDNDKAHFFTNVGVARKGGWGPFSYNVFEGSDVNGVGIKTQIDEVAKEKFGGATHCMLYIHGFSAMPQAQIETAMEINAKHWKGKGAFCIPVIWPFESPLNWSPQRLLDLAGYGTQKEGADGAARGLREEILPYLKHKIDKDGLDCEGTKVSISIMCHSMGNYVLKKMAPEEDSGFKFDNIFMVAADVRAMTFDKELGKETRKVDGKEVTDHDGEDILRLTKHKIHVCWYEGDGALLVRRPLNWGRAALGKNGLLTGYTLKPIADVADSEADEDKVPYPTVPLDEGKLVNKLAATDGKLWNDTVTGAAGINWATGHLYQTTDPALEYYLTSMKDNCDPDSDKC